MAKTISITVYPAGTDTDNLSVSDAMQQVLDIFELLAESEVTKGGAQANRVIWKLDKASTNSPFTVEATAVSSNPTVAIDLQANQAVMSMTGGVSHLLNASYKEEWIDKKVEKTVRKMLERNLNGIRRTDISVDENLPPLIIDHRSATKAVKYLNLLEAEEAAKKDDLTRTEYGSIEGVVIAATTHYDKPAFLVRERLSGNELTCVLSEASQEKVGGERKWIDVWDRQRVLITGALHYDEDGSLRKVDATDVESILSRSLSTRDIQRANLLDKRLSASEIVHKAWGSEYG